MYRNNIVSFMSVLEFAKNNNIKLVYASSASVFGNKGKPLNAYSHSKLICDEIAEKHFNVMSIVGLRFFNVYGKNEIHKGEMASMITRWSEQIRNGDRPLAFRNGTALRDHIYVKDVIKAMKVAEQKENGIYDVGIGTPETFDTVLRLVQETLQTEYEPILFDNPHFETYQMFTKAQLGWGFVPDYSLKNGIKDYLMEEK